MLPVKIPVDKMMSSVRGWLRNVLRDDPRTSERIECPRGKQAQSEGAGQLAVVLAATL